MAGAQLGTAEHEGREAVGRDGDGVGDGVHRSSERHPVAVGAGDAAAEEIDVAVDDERALVEEGSEVRVVVAEGERGGADGQRAVVELPELPPPAPDSCSRGRCSSA